ncbi:MAG: ferrochelatase [Cyanothece sp. SIO1E1]|nr:ferrochelatase [Cyanothece sp. SIO1E1]
MVVTAKKLQQQITDSSLASDRIAVLLVGYGEVECYDHFASYNEQALSLLTAKFAPIPAWIYPTLAKLLALFDFHEWKHRHNQFISPHNAIFERQRAGIERHLQAKWGLSQTTSGQPRVQVFKAFNFCEPFLPQQVLSQIKAQGFNKLLIYPLLVVDSVFTSGIAMEQVNQTLTQLADGASHWVKQLRYIPSFYDQPAYIDLLVRLVEEKIAQHVAIAPLPSQTGIILLSAGCPQQVRGFTSGVDESQALYEQVRERLIHRYPLISAGWINHPIPLIKWTQPDAERAAKSLIERGATALVFMPIGFVTENHETLLDLGYILRNLRHAHPDVLLTQVACVNDHPDFLQMAAAWADTQINRLLH